MHYNQGGKNGSGKILGGQEQKTLSLYQKVMTKEQALYIELSKKYSPAHIFDYFEMVNIEVDAENINAYSDENNKPDNKIEG